MDNGGPRIWLESYQYRILGLPKLKSQLLSWSTHPSGLEKVYFGYLTFALVEVLLPPPPLVVYPRYL